MPTNVDAAVPDKPRSYKPCKLGIRLIWKDAVPDDNHGTILPGVDDRRQVVRRDSTIGARRSYEKPRALVVQLDLVAMWRSPGLTAVPDEVEAWHDRRRGSSGLGAPPSCRRRSRAGTSVGLKRRHARGDRRRRCRAGDDVMGIKATPQGRRVAIA